MSDLMDRLRYVDEIAPEHDRASCNDTNMYNRAFGIDDYEGRGRCYRCTLLKAATSGKSEVTDEKSNASNI